MLVLGLKTQLAHPLPSRWYFTFLLFTPAPLLEGKMLLPHYALGFCLAPALPGYTLGLDSPSPCFGALDLGSILKVVSPFILVFSVGVRGHHPPWSARGHSLLWGLFQSLNAQILGGHWLKLHRLLPETFLQSVLTLALGPQ